MQTNDTQKLALINNTKEHTHTQNNAKKTEPGLVAFTTSCQERQRVYSFNPEPSLGANTVEHGNTSTGHLSVTTTFVCLLGV